MKGVTSYYRNSQCGKGKYIEKTIASSFEKCSLNIELSSWPLWFEYPSLHKRKGIFTQQGLSNEEKIKIRTLPWDWIGKNDVNTDVGCILNDEKSLVLVELKNRVDSGGTAGRREIWTSEKFGFYIDYLINNNKIFRKDNKEFSLAEFLEIHGINTLEIYIGVLFGVGDFPASIEEDRVHGFYSSSKQGFEHLLSNISEAKNIKIVNSDSENLNMELQLSYSKLKVKIGAIYGNEITFKLFRKNFPVTDLLLLKYDDIWLSLLKTIDERAVLLKQNKNLSTSFQKLLKADGTLRSIYNSMVISECAEKDLINIVNYCLTKYSNDINELIPENHDIDEYLSDLIQMFCAIDS
ncbi:MAG TPA: hypothetical protein P5268_07235 [Candidatus Marinimicrobia bacterium]|nr:hypothetical protein [Candidatus Neomarinimicrobiota bacterium]HRS51113.1 hypothetical protein [Candidatus Neomarinimicrobiota bacterium]HRU92808.1 hypothetical protein [Candidatus Neomarinimicrobiota bacterium]